MADVPLDPDLRAPISVAFARLLAEPFERGAVARYKYTFRSSPTERIIYAVQPTSRSTSRPAESSRTPRSIPTDAKGGMQPAPWPPPRVATQSSRAQTPAASHRPPRRRWPVTVMSLRVNACLTRYQLPRSRSKLRQYSVKLTPNIFACRSCSTPARSTYFNLFNIGSRHPHPLVRSQPLPGRARADYTMSKRTWLPHIQRQHAFTLIWPLIARRLEGRPNMNATELFDELRTQYPGRFHLGQRAALTNRVRLCRGDARASAEARELVCDASLIATKIVASLSHRCHIATPWTRHAPPRLQDR